ncbi:MAG: PIG-L family deacetylase [Deltaproteobacteria bacterium]|nr:PIG-L family deacetylase [Deltaproteobacteria bacterium]
MNEVLIISPHYDDAVFSCGGILSNPSQDYQFEVLNVFSHSGRRTAQRKKEEAAASEYLNYQSHSLGFSDYERRDFFGFLPSRMHRFLGAEDEEVFKKVETAFLDFLKNKNFHSLYFPLGIGMHIDHEICFRLAKSLSKQNSGEIYFYEDLPYALLPGLTELRLFQLGISSPESLAGWQDMADFLYTRPFWKRLKIFKKILTPLIKNFWQKRLRVLGQLPLKAKYFYLGYSLEMKNKAACLYESQVKDFFSSPEDSLECFKKYSEKVGVDYPSERVWQLL